MKHLITLLAVMLSLSAFAQNETDKVATTQAQKPYGEMTVNEFLASGIARVRLDDQTTLNVCRRRKVDYRHELRFSVGA